ncbi:GNAT family N-acetyltransferase [Pseudonocardia adelaidensis]|uniref:GNAT family N-acetyltransferase n=1 Tax=Pseudonocardia adelaidensis TaxID=648754 RepID=UPI0031E88B75
MRQEEGRLLAGGLLLHRKVLECGNIGYSIGYLPYGPVCPSGHHSTLALQLLTRVLSELAARRFHALFIQPPEDGELLRGSLLSSGFRPSYAQLAPIGSLRVDVQVEEDELRARARRRVRPAAKLWDKYRVTVREGGLRDIPVLARLLGCSAEIHGFRPFELDYLRTLYRELRPSGQVVLLIGEVDGVPLAADLLTVNAEMLRGRFVGFDRSGGAARTAVPAAVTWAGIQWARRHGLRWYDMGGLPEQVLSDMLDRGLKYNSDWPSTALAKLGWGALPFRYPAAVELVRPGVLRLAYEFSRDNPATKYLVHRAEMRLRG